MVSYVCQLACQQFELLFQPMQALKLTNPFQQPSNTHHHQYTPHIINTGQSESKDKLQFFKVQIRNNHIRDIKKRCRQELIISQHIEQLLTTLPVNWRDSLQWSSDFIRLYNEVKTMNLDSHQIVAIFFLAQKFPNRLTLQLLEIVVIRASGESIEILFQYDVMRLLHSAIVYDQAKRNSFHLNRSCSSEESEAIVREAVVDRVSSAIARIDLRGEESSEADIFQMVRSSVSIIGQLCKKSTPARNFAVINHKTYIYCLKAYKKYNNQIRKEFFRFLRAVTNIEFGRYEDQFERVSAKILNIMFRQNWRLEHVQDSTVCEDYLYCMKMLLLAGKNLIAMKDCWTWQKIQIAQKKYNYTMYQVAGTVIKDISAIVHQMKEIPVGVSEVLSAAIELVMHYEDFLDIVTKTATDNPRLLAIKQQMSIIYCDLVYILYQSLTMPSLQSVRKSIYFVLCNHLMDTQISQSTRYSLFEIVHNNCHIKLLHLLNDLLAVQFIPSVFYELTYVINTVFQKVPLSCFSVYMFESELIQGVCARIIDTFSSESKQSMGKYMLVRSLTILIQRLSRQGNPMITSVKSIIMHQYGNRLTTMLTKNTCSDKLYESIEQLLRQFQGEEWVES